MKEMFFVSHTVKLEQYNFGKWAKIVNKVNYFIFYENSACWA